MPVAVRVVWHVLDGTKNRSSLSLTVSLASEGTVHVSSHVVNTG